MKPKPDTIHVRWLIRRDLDEVLAIDELSHPIAWDEEDDFKNNIRRRNCIGMVVECNNVVVGFMVYDLHKNRLNILRFAVDPEKRNRGFGSRLVQKLVAKLSQQRRTELSISVDISNLTALEFLKGHGFIATGIEDDQVAMLFTLPRETEKKASSEFWAYDPVSEEFVGAIK